ncbi:MAG: FixH family protein [Gemmobacter sp.]
MRPITGTKVAIVTVGAFSIIIAVNLTLAYQAVATFPGVEVRNSYIASQHFDRDRLAQDALGWTVAQDYRDGVLRLTFTDAATGLPSEVADLSVLVGRATVARDDQTPVFIRHGDSFLAPLDLAPGKWLLRIEARSADGTRFQQRLDLVVRG